MKTSTDIELFENLKLELRRGCLIVAVLAQLRQEHYGYTLRKALEDLGLAIDEGTLYPLLRRLESQGLLASEWREENKRNKRFYRPPGRRADPETAAGRVADHQPIARTNFAGGIALMELLERYLQAVRFWLPRAQQEDIIAELGDDLRSQIEDKETALGRPVNEDELAAILQQTGHPMRVAARYQPQQSLIGPVLFPLYKFVLKMVTLFYLVPWVLVWIALVVFVPSHRADNPALTVLGGWASLWANAFVIFGIITLVFALLERFQSRIKSFHQWDPRKLPALPRRKDHVPRLESVFELVFSGLFILGWLALPGIAREMFAPASRILVANPALNVYYWLALIPTCLGMAQQFVNLFRPQWIWLRPPARLLSTALILGITAAMLKLYPYFTVVSGLPAGDAKDAARYANLAFAANQISHWGLICFAVALCIAVFVFAYQTVQIIRKYKRGGHDRASVQISQVL